MYRPSPILTMTSWQGETDMDRYQRLYDEQQAKLMNFITSPEVKECLKTLCNELITELKELELKNVLPKK